MARRDAFLPPRQMVCEGPCNTESGALQDMDEAIRNQERLKIPVFSRRLIYTLHDPVSRGEQWNTANREWGRQWKCRECGHVRW